MFLSSTSDVLRLITGSTGNIDVLASWADKNGTDISPNRSVTNITTATTTVIVASPASGVQRSIVTLSIKNKHTGSQVVKVALYDGSNNYEIVSATLEAGESLHYKNEAWVTMTASGNIKNFTYSGAGGDMTKAVYDMDDDGIVDNSELLEGQNSAYYLSRANHTGTQASSTISDLPTAIDTQVDALIGSTIQAQDADLDTIAGLTPTNDDFLQRKAGNWANRSVAQVKSDLGISGTNTGDQTSISGISGTKLEFNTACSDGDFLFTGDVSSYTDEAAQDAVGVMVDSSLVYDDVTPTLSRAALTGDVTASQGSNSTTIANNAVTLGKMAQLATARFIGRITGGTGDPESLTGTQATSLLDTFTSSLKGLVPASGGGTTNFLRADGTWAAPGGGGGTPGGSDTEIQFNDGGTFGGDSNFTWNKTTNDLVLSGTDVGITLAGITNEPSPPSSGNLQFYSKSIAGRMIPKILGPSGIDTPLQVAFWQNNIIMWNPTTATAGVWLGSAGAGAGTYSTALPTTTSLYTAMKRGRWANVVTTTNQVLGQRNTEALFFFGNTAGMGGFFFYTRCGFDVWTNGGRFYAGLHSGTTVISADPSGLANIAGFCCESADSGGISIITRGSSLATKTFTGFTITSGKGYDLYLFAAPNSTVLNWRIVELNTGAEASGTVSTTMPAVNTMLTAGVLASNAALTTATAIQLGVNRIYVETDR